MDPSDRRSLLHPSGRVPDLVICLVAQGARGTVDGWLFADELRIRIHKLAGVEVSAQYLTSRLQQMCREDAPRFERGKSPWDAYRYRVTQWGRNSIDNAMPGLRRV